MLINYFFLRSEALKDSTLYATCLIDYECFIVFIKRTILNKRTVR